MSTAHPEAIQQMLNQVEEIQSQPEAPQEYNPETRLPRDGEVALCGGYITPEGDLVETAQVRELNGRDEEHIARLSSAGKQMLAILSRGVELIGRNKPTEDDLDLLLAADRDLLMLEIRKMTFGDTLEIPFLCPHCKTIEDEPITYEYDLTTIKVKSLEDKVRDRNFTVKLRRGEARCTLPNGVAQKELYLTLGNKSTAEMNTMMLFNCVRSINGQDILFKEQILDLGMSDRETLIKAVGEHSPGPQWQDVALVCPDCAEEVPFPLAADSLFRL